MDNCTPITSCVACGSTDLIPTLDLGEQPLANNFRSTTAPEPRYPLAINRCNDCDHLQLTHAVDPALIYTHYLYVSGTSRTYVEYMDWYARFVREQFDHWPTTVLDIGCNDGSQLDAFKKLGFKTYGVDPAKNLHADTVAKGHTVICDFWPTDQGFDTQFDVITAQNSFAHNPDPLSWLLAARQRMTNTGMIFISTSQADMVVNGEFDTIYHEHISFYNAASMQALAERAGLHLIDVVKTPIHGTSYIFILGRQPKNKQRVENILAMEATAGLADPITYRGWAVDVATLIRDLRDTAENYQSQGYKIVGYGAAAKGMTLINASGIKLDAVVDDNPLKQGTLCPGADIPVVSINYLERLAEDEQVLFIPLAWNFYREIKSKILKTRNNLNDRFMTYFPKIRIER